MRQLKQSLQATAAAEATGLPENPHGLGQFYIQGGKPVTARQAAGLLWSGKVVEVPNAGAGSYSRFFETLGFEEVQPLETGSSSGDWTLAVKAGDYWHATWQNNRYPYYGFGYRLAVDKYASSLSELRTLLEL